MSTKQEAVLIAGLSNEDAMGVIESAWGKTEYKELTSSFYRYFRNYTGDIQVPASPTDKTSADTWYRAVKSKLVGTWFKDVDVLNFSAVAGSTIGELFGTVNMTGKEARAKLYNFVAKHRLNHPQSIPATQGDRVSVLGADMQAVLRAAGINVEELLAKIAVQPTVTETAPPKQDFTDAEIDAAVAETLKNMAAKKAAEAAKVAEQQPVKTGKKGKKKGGK